MNHLSTYRFTLKYLLLLLESCICQFVKQDNNLSVSRYTRRLLLAFCATASPPFWVLHIG
jgi:hypothetical protein